jgi:two-component system sensor histidine kinase/response regulator
MTAHATIEERQRCLASGMNDHISKPIDPVMLFETISRFYKAAPQPPEIRSDAGGTAKEAIPQNTVEAFPQVAGLDTSDGLTRVAGNRKLYRKLLRQFVEQQGPAVSQISAALAQQDVSGAERLAHTLKGVAGNIGAKPVHEAAGALEKLIRERAGAADIEVAKSRVASVLEPLRLELERALSSEARESVSAAAASAPTADRAQVRMAAEQLTKLLAEFDPGATDFIEANQGVLVPLFASDALREFEKLVQSYSFADAQTQLEQALKDFTK